jgi:integrase
MHIPAFRTHTRGGKVRVRYLIHDQAKMLLDELLAHQAAAVLFALATDLRQGNILGLTWDRVDLTRRIATIGHGGTSNGAEPYQDDRTLALAIELSLIFSKLGEPSFSCDRRDARLPTSH